VLTFEKPLDVRPVNAEEAIKLIVRLREVEAAEEEDKRRMAARVWATAEMGDRLDCAGDIRLNLYNMARPTAAKWLQLFEPKAYQETLAAALVAKEARRLFLEARELEKAEEEVRRLARAANERNSKAARIERLALLACALADENARTRLEMPGSTPLGLMPEDEALAIVTNANLPVGNVLHEYERLVASDATHDEDGDECGGTIGFRAVAAEDTDGIDAEELTVILAINSALAAARLPKGEIRVHTAECDAKRCPQGVRRIGVRVKLDLGDGLVIEREYGAA